MQHHICTGFGVSKDTYGSSVDKLLYGIGQGSCASPILWALLNQIILAALEEKFYCTRLVAVDGVEEHIRPGDSLVDDTTGGVTDDDVDMEPVPASVTNLTDGEEALVGRMEDIIQFFLDLLQVTGGDLTPYKCAWFHIAFRWKEGKASIVTPNATHGGIELVSQSTGTRTTIKRKAPSESHRTRGFHLNWDGTSTGHKRVMMDKIRLYSEAVDISKLWKSEGSLAYNAFYMKSIGHGTPETSLSYQECDNTVYCQKWESTGKRRER
jgi:hypothetical protein